MILPDLGFRGDESPAVSSPPLRAIARRTLASPPRGRPNGFLPSATCAACSG